MLENLGMEALRDIFLLVYSLWRCLLAHYLAHTSLYSLPHIYYSPPHLLLSPPPHHLFITDIKHAPR